MSKSTSPYWNPLAENQRHRWCWLEGLEGQVEEVILSRDPASGEFTRLTRFLPGADTAAFGPTVHDYPEEILIMSGRLWDDAFGMWLETGHYASRPPGELHGPFRSEEGCLVLDVSFPQRQGRPAADVLHVDHEAILRFWFQEIPASRWFARDPVFDQRLRERFEGLTQAAVAGELSHWGEAPRSGLALILLLDQFPRQIWRGNALAFGGDGQALALSQQAVAKGWVVAEPEPARRQFWLMPWMHAEDLAVQEASLPLFERFTDPRTTEFARRHRDVIARFGRFPHRNAVLGRASSAEEIAFLLTPGSGF